jgi:hypothetical protein
VRLRKRQTERKSDLGFLFGFGSGANPHHPPVGGGGWELESLILADSIFCADHEISASSGF